MIKTGDVIKAVNTKLKNNFKDHKVCSADIRKKVEPGSFYVEWPTPVLDGTQDFRHEEGMIRVVYFPKDDLNNRIEFMEMQIALYEAFFDILWIDEEFAIPVNDLTFEESDGALIMNFDYEIFQEIEEDGELMKNIEVGVKI